MKYENPIMSVSLFDTENVATTGSAVMPAMDVAESEALKAVNGVKEKVITVTF